MNFFNTFYPCSVWALLYRMFRNLNMLGYADYYGGQYIRYCTIRPN